MPARSSSSRRPSQGSVPVAGQPAVLAFTGRQLAGVLVFTMRGGLIQAVHVIGDPRKLDFPSSQLTALAKKGRPGPGTPAWPASLSAGASRPYWCRRNPGGQAKEKPDELAT
jgi:hypothetical protein